MKKYNIEQMNTFCGILHHRAFEAGVQAAANADLRIMLYKVLENTKGVGPILTKRIMEAAKDTR